MTAVAIPGVDTAPTTHQRLLSWVREVAELTTPDQVVWVRRLRRGVERLTAELVEAGTFTRLAKKPNSFWAASDPDDVARVEERTFICSSGSRRRRAHQQLDGPGRDEGDHDRAVPRLDAWSDDVRDPVLHGPARPPTKPMLGVEITDSAYVVASMKIMTRMGTRGAREVLRRRGQRARLRAGPALGRRPARARASRTCPGRATRPSTSPTSPRSGRSGATARATAATRCSARSATRCASPR